jgi:hypothetical protein
LYLSSRDQSLVRRLGRDPGEAHVSNYVVFGFPESLISNLCSNLCLVLASEIGSSFENRNAHLDAGYGITVWKVVIVDERVSQQTDGGNGWIVGILLRGGDALR